MEQLKQKINELIDQMEQNFKDKVRELTEYVDDALERADERSYKQDEYGNYVSNDLYEGMTRAYVDIETKIIEIFTGEI